MRRFFSDRSIKSDFLLYTIPVLILGILLNAWSVTKVEHNALLEDSLDEMYRRMDEVVHNISSIDAYARRDMLLTMENPYFYEYFTTQRILADLSADAANREALVFQQKERRRWLESAANVLQKRYHIVESCLIDLDGREHLRVVRGINQPEEEFSTIEKETPVFAPAFALNKGEVAQSAPYISPDAHEWVIAYTSPVLMPDGTKPAFFHFEVPLNHFKEAIIKDKNIHYDALGFSDVSKNLDFQIVINQQGLLLFDNYRDNLVQYHKHSPAPENNCLDPDASNVSTEGLATKSQESCEKKANHGHHDNYGVLSDYFPHAKTLFDSEKFFALLAKIQAGQSGSGKFNVGDKNYYIVFRDIPGFGWGVANIRSEDSLFTGATSIGEVKKIVIGISFGIVLISIIFILIGAERVIRPLRQLSRSANIAGGELLECAFINNSYQKEIKILANSLHSMCEILRSHQRDLQRTIVLKTEHLQIANNVLRDTIVDLEETSRMAEAANQSKSLFVANMSHEIRTPMNAILGMTHLCMQTEPNPRQKDYLEKIYGSANSLLHIINDILDFSKVDAGKMVLENIPFHLDDVLNDLSTLITIKALDKKLEVVFFTSRGVPHALLGDPTRLRQILINLCNNAVKFTDSGEVVLSIGRVESQMIHPSDYDAATDLKGQAVLKFSVRDSGIGLTPDQIDRLFHAFSQADGSSTRKHGGTGLGLAISKHLVELMGGTIWVESTPGQGSVFCFTARFSLPDQSKRRKLQLPEDLQKKRVLVMDDNSFSRGMLQTALESFSFYVTAVSSGMDGLVELDKKRQEGQPFDLLMLDWHMPDLNGVQIFRCMKSLEQPYDLPTVFMVPFAEQANVKQEMGEPQPEAYLDKPVQLSYLFDTIMNLFGRGGILPVVRGRVDAQLLPSSRTITGGRVLLVEDNELNQQVGRELLEMMGVMVEIAKNGIEAVKKVELFEYDLVLMDIQMPLMDGYQATREIRKMPHAASLPIVAMTANVMVSDLALCWEATMNDHIAKPIDPRKLFFALNKWIKPQEGIALLRENMATPKDQEADIFPSLPGIDTKSGLFYAGGSSSLLHSLLVKFSENNSDFVGEFQQSLTKEDLEQARRMVHTLKGAAGTIGAIRLQTLAAELESSLVLSADFSAELDLVLGSIKGLPPSKSGENVVSAPKVIDPAILLQALKNLRPHVEKKRPKNCEPILEELAQMEFPAAMQGDIERLTGLIKKYKLKDALPVLDFMISQMQKVE